MSIGDIAIIGMDLTLPGCGNMNDAWNKIRDKRISVGKFPTNRHAQIGELVEDIFMPGSYLEHIDQFDHKYFNIAQKSADFMDPNQRLTLLSATRALNDAGCLEQIRGTQTSVYASVNSTQQYQYQLLLQQRKLKPDLLGMLNSTISSRIQYIYDLRGASIMTDTACSSSLVSIIQASNDLRQGIIDQAIVVSSNLYVKPGYKSDKLVDILATDARTRTFDDRSTGTSIGEGVGSVILKRKEDAERDGNFIYGLIRSYAMNNDGQTMNMSSPNPDAQERLIEQAWAPLQDEMQQLAFIEAHGTGTAIGDTIEFESLSNYFSERVKTKQKIALTACKSNFGHLDVTSGLFSLIKSALSLRNRVVLPHPDFQIPNEEIDFETSAFYIPDQSVPLEEHALAGISSFGMTGTNAHVILQQYSCSLPSQVKELPLNLKSYWFPLDENSFTVQDDLQRLETDEWLIVQFPLHSKRQWEIREHQFNGKHLLVGTSIFEMIAQGLDCTPYTLEHYDITGLHIMNQMAVQDGPLTILLKLDKKTLKVVVTYRTAVVLKTWLQFELHDKSSLHKPIRRTATELDQRIKAGELMEVAVTSQVGGEGVEDIAVSRRWDVVDRLWTNQEHTRAVVKLRPPSEYKVEFSMYSFYPSILDPAFNALNRMAEPEQIVFPWYWSDIRFEQFELVGEEFYSEIELVDRTMDERGNIILSLNVNLFDGQWNLILSADHYKVKNALNKEESSSYFKQEEIIPATFTQHSYSPSEAIHFVHESLRSQLQLDSPIVYFTELTEINEKAIGLQEKDMLKHVYLWDRNYTEIDRVADETYTLGKVLISLNKILHMKKFYYVNSGVLGYTDKKSEYPKMNALNRSIAMGAYALRLEVNSEVIVVDTDHTYSTDVERVDYGSEQHIIHREGKFYILRLKSLKVDESSRDKFSEGKTVLIVGASSGIGEAYTRDLADRYADIHIIAAGRRSVWDGLPSRDNVSYLKLDISNEDEVSSFAAQYHGKLDYILNFAGEPAQGLFVNKSRNEFCAKTKSKIEGSHLLGMYFPEVQEIIHFSSLAGVIGAMGQAEYSMANAYQSGLPLTNTNVRVLNLTGWQDVGMSAGMEDYYFEKLTSAEGIPLLNRFIQSNAKSAALFKLKRTADEYSSLFSPVTKMHRKQQTEKVYTGSDRVKDHIVAAWGRTLGEDDYDHNVSFFEQGGDSITIVHLCDELNLAFPGQFDVTTLFSIATIQGQVDLINQLNNQEAVTEQSDGHYDAAEMLAFLNK